MASSIEFKNIRSRNYWARGISKLFSPTIIFFILQIVWLSTVIIWVVWFVEEARNISLLTKKYGIDKFDDTPTILIMIVGCILLGVIFFGILMLFISSKRQSSLALRQRTFLSSVSHELKTPLASIQLAFETIFARDLDSQTLAKMELMINNDINRLTRLVNQILIAGRIDRGLDSYKDDFEKVELRSLVENIIHSLAYLDKNIHSRTSLDCPKDLTIFSSKNALELIFSNIIENAVKYSPNGKDIEIHIKKVEKTLLFEVQDQGIGINKNEQKQVVKMFERGIDAKERSIAGTGLGLYIVNAITKSLKGSISIKSEGRNKGCTISGSIPLENTRR